MRFLDKLLQKARIRKAQSFIGNKSSVLDIGSDTGELFRQIDKISNGVGIDPNISENIITPNFTIYKGTFPDSCPNEKLFDAITLLAVIEHIPEKELKSLASECCKFLKNNGIVIITVPSPKVDLVLKWLKRFRLIDGMNLEEHHGFEVSKTSDIFSAANFKLVTHQKFQLGLNNLFAFQKTI